MKPIKELARRTRFFPGRARWLAAVSTALLPMVAHAQNALHWTTNYYSVTGATPREIRQSIDRSRPWKTRLKADGLTNWRIDWHFTVAPTSGGCRCASFSTTTKITVTLPRWTAPTNVVESTKVRWDRYIQALGQHEAGHAQLTLAAQAELHRRIKALGEQPDCDAVKNRVNDAGQNVLQEFRKREKDYDERTQNGMAQGAVLP